MLTSESLTDVQYVVANNNQRTDDGGPPAPNQRTRVLDCGRENGQPRVWYPGYHQDVPAAAVPLARFGQHMRDFGILTGDSYQHYNPNAGQAGGWDWPPYPHPEHRNSNQFGPTENGQQQPGANMDPSQGWPT